MRRVGRGASPRELVAELKRLGLVWLSGVSPSELDVYLFGNTCFDLIPRDRSGASVKI